MTPRTYGCICALQKLGFDLNDVHRLLRAVKPRVLKARKATNEGILSAFAKSKSPFAPAAPAAFSDASIEYGIREGLVPESTRQLRGKMIMPQRGDIVQTHRHVRAVQGLPPIAAPNTPQARQTLEAVSKGHELDEILVSRRGLRTDYLAEHGHASPTVLLREHNRLATLPKKLQDARRYVQTLRSDEPAIAQLASAIPGFEFGESPRLSRHAIERLTAKITT